jgi:hypothetical protein
MRLFATFDIDNNATKSYDALLAQAVSATAKHFNVSASYVRGARNGTNKGGQTEAIKRHCNLVYKQLQKALAVHTT